ncbi:hypothetical protein Tco_0209475 [Tanacetum coccineum]
MIYTNTLGSSNPCEPQQDKLSQPTLYDGHALLNTTHRPVRVHDSEDALVQAEVSRAKMSKRPGTIQHINYAELNALYSHFVPKNELSREQVYLAPADKTLVNLYPLNPWTPFVLNRPAKSQISTCLHVLNTWIPAFAHVIKQRTDPCRYPHGSREFKPVKAMFTEQIIPFYENVKQLVQKLNGNIVTEVTEYMRIFDELDTEYERCVLANKNLKIERKNILIQNECLIANCLEKDIFSIVLTSDIVVPPSLNCLCEELRSNCNREHSKVIELEAEILKKQQMLNESEKRCAFIEKNHDQLQGKDDTIRNLQTQINITRMLNVGPTVGSFDKQALETELSQLKDAPTSVRIQNDRFKAKNVNLKRRYEELSNSNTYSRSTFTAKINALTAENAKLKNVLSGKKSSGSTASEKHKVLASGMYTNSSKIMEPIIEHLELTPSVSSSSKVTMISRFTDCKLSDRKAGSKGISTDSNCIDSLFTIPLRTSGLENNKHTGIWYFGIGGLKGFELKICQEEQMATGKEISNPFLADSLLKTISRCPMDVPARIVKLCTLIWELERAGDSGFYVDHLDHLRDNQMKDLEKLRLVADSEVVVHEMDEYTFHVDGVVRAVVSFWDHFKDLLRACPHHGFTELHQLDTFYNALNPTDQYSLNAAAGGNLLTKTPRDALTIIENKSKVHNSRNKPIVSKVNTSAPSSSTPHSPEIAALVDAVKAMLH